MSAVSILLCIQSSDHAIKALSNIIVEIESVSADRAKICRIRMENGGDYKGKQLLNWFTESSIIPQCPLPYSPETNRRAKRIDGTVIYKERVMLSRLDSEYQKLWAESIDTANHIRNCMLNGGCHQQDMIPIEDLMSVRRDVSNLRTFECTAYVNVSRQF